MKKRVALLTMLLVMLTACGNKGNESGASSFSGDGKFEEVVELMTEYSKLGSSPDAVIDEAFDSSEESRIKNMSQEERAKFDAELGKKYEEAKANAEARGEEIKERLSQLAQELADKSINTEPDLNVPLEVVKPFHISEITPQNITIECTAKVLIDRVIKDESIRKSFKNYDFCVSAYAEDADGNSVVDKFRLMSEQIDNYSNDLPAGTEVTLRFTFGFVNGKLFPILTAHKIVLLWPAPIDDIDDEMDAEEGSEMD